MAMFKDMLGSEESLFKNEMALDFSFQPKLVPYREKEQFQVASCIKPLFKHTNGKNIIITGKPGIGKTVATKHILNELEEETDEVYAIYINCWQKNTTYKVAVHICEHLGYKFVHNKKGDELLGIITQMLNKKSTVFVFDEVDKLEDYDFLYHFLEEVYRKAIVLVTNYKEWLIGLDQRVRSRLMPETIEFGPYNQEETKGILIQRKDAAFMPNVWEEEAFGMVVLKTSELEDIRSGLYLMKQAGHEAESDSSRKITKKHVEQAISKMPEMKIKSSEDLEDEARFVLNVIKKNSNKKIGELYKIYQENGGSAIYKTFQRKVQKLADNKYISLKKITGGAEGTTTIISYSGKSKKLSDY